jgi:copper homeostasis protein
MNLNRTLEICVDSVPAALAAAAGGADRIELCENLYQGGVTPSAAKITLAKAQLQIPVFVLIRPRKGDFLYSREEFRTLLEDISLAIAMGADGIVSGVLTAAGDIDLMRTAEMVAAAEGRPFTFHRAFDMCKDPLQAIEELAACGVSRILSSGQEPDAQRGLSKLMEFSAYAAGKLSIMACGGLLPDNIAPLLEVPTLSEFHAAVRKPVSSGMLYRGAVNMGDEEVSEEYNWHDTDENLVRGLKKAILT